MAIRRLGLSDQAETGHCLRLQTFPRAPVTLSGRPEAPHELSQPKRTPPELPRPTGLLQVLWGIFVLVSPPSFLPSFFLSVSFPSFLLFKIRLEKLQKLLQFILRNSCPWNSNSQEEPLHILVCFFPFFLITHKHLIFNLFIKRDRALRLVLLTARVVPRQAQGRHAAVSVATHCSLAGDRPSFLSPASGHPCHVLFSFIKQHAEQHLCTSPCALLTLSLGNFLLVE